MHFSCTHGIVYYLNFMLWKESARDHVDGLLSFNVFPTVYVSDVAGQVSRHMNNRTTQKYFHPHDGRWVENTETNRELAKEGNLEFTPEWVKTLCSKTYQEPPQMDSDPFKTVHPITHTTERISLYDRFHQQNQTRDEELLRSMNICPEFRAQMNSSVAEQLNRQLASVRYSFCEMKESTFKLQARVIMEMHNRKINRAYRKDMDQRCTYDLEVGPLGTLTVGNMQGCVGKQKIGAKNI